jgi:hypothetical protein
MSRRRNVAESRTTNRPAAPNSTPPSSNPTSAIRPNQLPAPLFIGVVIITLILAAALRFWASLDDLWLDEIWTLEFASHLTNPLEVITRLHHDNNHYLNTWVMYALGKEAPGYLYRLPAILAGVGTVVLSGVVARSWDRVAGLTALVITGFSFLLIEYSSEARGYAYLLFFTIASFAVMQKSLDQPRRIWDVLFALCALLGFLSHLTYLFAYVALICWSLWRRVYRDGWFARRHLVPFICEIVIPGAFIVFLYLIDLRFLGMGGGNRGSVWNTIAQAVSAAFGGPLEGDGMMWVQLAVVAIAAVALWLMVRVGSDLWVPMAAGIFVVPGAILLIVKPEWPHPRYFLVGLLFLQLLMSWFLGWLYHRTHGRVAYFAIMLVILGGNTYLTARFLKYGRGHYRAAVEYLLEQTPGEQVFIGSDHDFRNKLLLAYYAWRAGAENRVAYYDMANWPPEGPEWLLLHNSSQKHSCDPYAEDRRGNTYRLARFFPFAGLSGFNWALYRNMNHPATSPQQPVPQGP